MPGMPWALKQKHKRTAAGLIHLGQQGQACHPWDSVPFGACSPHLAHSPDPPPPGAGVAGVWCTGPPGKGWSGTKPHAQAWLSLPFPSSPVPVLGTFSTKAHPQAQTCHCHLILSSAWLECDKMQKRRWTLFLRYKKRPPGWKL